MIQLKVQMFKQGVSWNKQYRDGCFFQQILGKNVR